jgi:hypothetical protein
MADRYWIGGSGTWNTSTTTRWSATSGGAGGASAPTSADDVFFPSGGTVTLSGGVCRNMTVTSSTTFSGTGALTVYGSMSLSSTTWSGTGTLTFNSSTTNTVTTNGITLNCDTLTFTGVGTWTLGSALNVKVAGTIEFTSGTLDLASFTISTGKFNSSNSNTRAILFGSGYIDVAFSSNSNTNIEMGNGTNFSWTGTGGFRSVMSRTRLFSFGNGGGMSSANAPNLYLTSGSSVYGISSGSWFNMLDLGGTSSTPASATYNVNSIILGSSTSTYPLTVNVRGTGTLNMGTRTINTLDIQSNGTSTLVSNIIVSGTTTFGTSNPSIIVLNGYTLTTGTFNSSSTLVRSINFGTTNIVSTSGGFNMSDVRNFTWSGTGGICPNASASQTVSYGNSAGGSADNAINMFITGSGSASRRISLSGGSWFKTLNCSENTIPVGATAPSVSSVYANSVILSSTAGATTAYTGLQIDFYGATSTVSGSGKQLYTFTAPSGGTVTLTSALAVTLYTHAANTLDLAGFTLTCSLPTGTFTYTGGTLTLNSGTIACYNYVHTGPNYVLDNGSITFNSTSGTFTLNSGSFTLAAGAGGTLGSVPLITQNAGTMILRKSYTMLSGSSNGKYLFNTGVLDITDITLSTPSFSSNNTNTRSILFGTGTVNLTYPLTSGLTVLDMSNITNFTYTGTGGFTVQTDRVRVITFGNGGGASIANAPKLVLTGSSSSPDISAGSWFNTIDTTGSTATITGTNLNIRSLNLGTSATHSTMSFNIVDSGGTISGNGRTFSSLNINPTTSGDITITSSTVMSATCTFATSNPCGLVLNADLTVGSFSSSSNLVRSINFGTSYIITTQGSISMSDATNFTWTGTGGFKGTQAATGTVSFGNSSGGSASNAIKLYFNAGTNDPTISAGSWLDTLSFIGTTGDPIAGGAGPYVRVLELGTGPIFTSFNVTMYGTGTISNSNSGKLINNLYLATGASITLQADFYTAQPYTHIANTTLNFNGYIFNTTGAITVNGGSLINFGTTACTTFTVNNDTSVTVNSGSLNPTTSIVINSGSFTLGASGSLGTTFTTFTHTAGTVTFLKSYSMNTLSTYSFSSGTLTVDGFTLSVGIFSSNNSNVRTINFGTGIINAYYSTSGSNVINMSNITNFTYTGTGGFTVPADRSRTVTMANGGGGSSTTALNLTITGTSGVISLASGSWFNILDFGSTSFAIGTSTTLNCNTLYLSGGLSSTNLLTFNILGTGNINLGGKTIGPLTINHSGTSTFTGSGGCSSLTQTSGDINFATNSLTSTGTITFTSGIYSNIGTLSCTTFTLGATFELTSGTLTASTSFVIDSGSFTFTDGTFTATPTFTHNAGTVTFAKAYAMTATGTYTFNAGNLILTSVNLTTGIFSSTNSTARSIDFGTGNIVLAHSTAGQTVLNMANATNCTVTGTGGFTAEANVTRTFTFGTTGGSYSNAPSLTLTGTGTAIATLTSGSYFNNLSFGTTAFTLATTSLNLNGLTLSSSGTYTGLSITMRGTGTVTSNGKTIAAVVTNSPGTTTLGSNLTCSTFTQTTGTIDFANYTLTCSGAFSSTTGTLLNVGTVASSSFSTGADLTFGANASVTSTSLNLTGGTFTYDTGNLSTLTTFTQTGGNLVLSANLTLISSCTYALNEGNLNLNARTLTLGYVSSTGTGSRSITGTGGTITVGYAWTVTSGAGFTGSGYNINMYNPDVKTFAGGGGTYGTLIQEGVGALTITGSNTFQDIQISPNMINNDLFQAAFTTPGTYSWVVPAGVLNVCVVCIGGGGGGDYAGYGPPGAYHNGDGGGGGGLGWKNNIAVTPGQSYTVVAGAGGTSNLAGGDSYFVSPATVKGGGGMMGYQNRAGGTYVGDGGGNGGIGGTGGGWGSGASGGGGAGGYAGNGGAGAGFSGSGTLGPEPGAGSGGGGGGGGATAGVSNGSYASAGAGGGGVGSFGQGTNGAPGSNALITGGGGGSYVSPSSQGTQGGTGSPFQFQAVLPGANGGNYGGGGGGGGAFQYQSAAGGTGGGGIVRIIWGSGRAFPSTNTGDIF